MRAGLWISDSEGSARSVVPLHMKETNVGSYSKCKKEGCIWDVSKGCENSMDVGAKPFPTHDSDCTWGSQTGNHNPNQNTKMTTGLNHHLGIGKHFECIPSAYCSSQYKFGDFTSSDKCRIWKGSTAATDDPVNHGRQCAFHKNDALTKCKAWDLCVGVICGHNGHMGDYCLGKYIFIFFFPFRFFHLKNSRS